MGTEPGAGCTTLACALAAALRLRGHPVGVLKPVAIGCPRDEQTPGALDDEQAALARLAAVAGPLPGDPAPPWALRSPETCRLLAASASDLTPDEINPYRFAPNLEPAVAARADGAEIDLQQIQTAWKRAAAHGATVIVDGGVGPLVPLDTRKTLLDLMQLLALPTVLVVPSRPWAAINATLLAVHVLQGADVAVAGVVLNRTHRQLQPEEAANPFQIEQHGKVAVRGLLPFLADEQLEHPEQLARRLEVHVDLDGILSAEG